MTQVDLFGNEIIEDVLLRDRFIEPPFSVLDTKSGSWQLRKNKWKEKGIEGEIGRNMTGQKTSQRTGDVDYLRNGKVDKSQYISIFDPALTELMYRWFCPDNGKILDPFAGGSVRGVVAHYLGYKYIGLELSFEQVMVNKNNALDILNINNQPVWFEGDSDKILNDRDIDNFDMIFSCPPYMDLEIYSNDKDDLSNMNDDDFIKKYESIINKSCNKLKKDGFACFVVGDVRDKKTGFYKDFITITKMAFYKAGMKLYNEMVLLNPVASASMRAAGNMKTKKIVKIHQNALVFKKAVID